MVTALAIDWPHLFEDLAVVALEAGTDRDVAGITEAGDHPWHHCRRLFLIEGAVPASCTGAPQIADRK